MEFVALVIGVFFAVLIGDLVYNFISGKKSVGYLRIDKSDPDGPYLFLELKEDPKILETKKFITLEINLKNYITQK